MEPTQPTQPTRSMVRRRRPRTAAPVLVAGLALVVASCTTDNPNAGSGPPSTIAPGSPWVGTFDSVTLPAPVNSLTAVDCVGPLRCWAVGSTVGTAGAPNGAAVVTTADGGSTWTIQPIPTAVGYLSAISCSDRHYCVAVGQVTQTSGGQGAIITTSDGGTTWTAATVPAGILDVTAVDCRASRRCMAIGTAPTGSVALASSPARPAWVQQGTLPPDLTGASGISCPDNQHCWVTIHQAIDVDHVSGQVALTTDGGSTWATTATPKSVGYLNGIVCSRGAGADIGLPFTSTTASTSPVPPSASVTTPPGTTPSGTAAGSTTTSGPSPTTTTSPPPTSTTTTAPPGVSGAWCVAVGTTASTVTGTRTGHGVVLTTTDGGSSWASQPVNPTSAALMGVSCTAYNACVTVGSAVGLAPEAGMTVLTGPDGHPWRQAAAVTSPQVLTAVSCISLSRCVLVGESISQRLVTG
jgi:photosystem II stability/assembly factor-like uncharacterized protein